MVAAALTVWMLFSFWLIASYLPAATVVRRIAMALLVAELVVLLLWSYGTEGCRESDCAPLAQAAGIAARVDVPLLAGLFVIAALAHVRRHVVQGLPE